MDILNLPQDFSQTVSLFPLSSEVLFPGLVQVLHIFEPRYVQLTEDALRGDKLITRALIKADLGSAVSAFPIDAIHPIVCIGKIISHTRLEDGRFNLVLVGICRARITGELDPKETGKLYRQAAVEFPSESSSTSAPEPQVRDQVLSALASALSGQSAQVQGMLKHLQAPDLPLGQMLDWIAHACGQSPDQQQRVLNAIDLDSRIESVMEIITTLTKGRPQTGIQFPPKFSQN